MVVRPPSGLLFAAQSSCRRCVSRTTIERFNSRILPFYPLLPSKKPFSTSGTRNESEARQVITAPEINLDNFKPSPSRIVPASRSYFSALPRFTDDFLALQALYEKYELLPSLPGAEARRRAWIKLAQYRNQVGEPVPSSRYQRVLQLLKRLNRIHPDVMPEEVQASLANYLAPGDPYGVKPKPQTLDEDGKAKGVGRRKEASAQVYLVEGEGEVLINGKSILQAFPRLHDRESAIWPLKVTNRIEKYNVWALTTGGGVTGQAEAITLGLAKALMVHEPALKPILRKGVLRTLSAFACLLGAYYSAPSIILLLYPQVTRYHKQNPSLKRVRGAILTKRLFQLAV
jgi:small subunit ribosomal protein S9